MKKSQLRNIIKESIKQLMTEQNVSTTWTTQNIDTHAINSIDPNNSQNYDKATCFNLAADAACSGQYNNTQHNQFLDCINQYKQPCNIYDKIKYYSFVNNNITELCITNVGTTNSPTPAGTHNFIVVEPNSSDCNPNSGQYPKAPDFKNTNPKLTGFDPASGTNPVKIKPLPANTPTRRR